MSETEVTTEAQIEVTDDLDAFSNDFFGQKSEEDKSTSTKVDAEQEEVTETSDETDAQTENDKDDAELEEEIPDKPKRKTVQDRIDEVVRQREELRRATETEITKLRQELEDFKKGNTQVQAQTENLEPTPEATDKDGEPLYPLGEFDPQYIRDLTKFTLNQERTRVQAEMAETQRQTAAAEAQQTLQTGWNERVTQSTEEYPDFVEKGQELLNGFNDLDSNYANYLTNVLMSMDKGTDVLYYLASHPEEAKSIVNSGAQKATLALGRIESRFISDDKLAPKPKITKAPPPATVQARGTNGAFIAVAPDTDDLDAFSSQFFRKK